MVYRVLRLVRERPGLAGVVVGLVDGRPVTLGELAGGVERGDPRYISLAERLGVDPVDVWRLAEEYFKSLRGTPVRVYVLGEELRPEDIVRHIRARDRVGELFVRMYSRLLRRVMG